jgi:hypothetical protein
MNLPAIGETIQLPEGTIQRLSEALFVGTTPTGKLFYSSRRTRIPDNAYRFVENKLLEASGEAPKPVLCANCGLRPKAPKSAYCSFECKCAAIGAKRSHLSAGEEFFASLSREEILARLAVIAPEMPTPDYATAPPPDFAHLLKNEPLRCTIALQQAKALIKRRRKGYAVLDQVLERAQRRQVLRREKVS